MSLKIWLPLNGNIENLGLIDWTPTIQTNTTEAFELGKIGQALSTGGIIMPASVTKQILNNDAFSYTCWLYIKGETGSTSQRSMVFGNDAMAAAGGRQFSLFNYPSCNDLHWSWQNYTNGTYSSAWGGVLYGVCPSNEWTHIAVTYQKGGRTKIYINGEVQYNNAFNSTADSFEFDTQLIWNSAYHRLNDVRLYDHCLSTKQVKQIYKTLVLHYPLDGKGFGNPNLLTDFDTSFLSYADGTFSLFSNQMNGGTQEIVSNINGAEKCLHLSSAGGNNRQYRTKAVLQGKTYTVSADYYSTNSQSVAWRGELSGGNYTWLGANAAYTTPGQWQRLSYTYSNLTSDATIYFFIYCANGQDCYVKNIKIEEGPYATPWCPSPNDSLYSILDCNSPIIYDESGYKNNGIILYNGANPNLFRLTSMSDRSNFVANSNSNFNIFFKYYNGNSSLHTFTESSQGGYEDTILLNQAANLGIAFCRYATDIDLDPTSSYTLSCQAKCTKSGAHLDIGLSYYNTSNSWVWRGGSNPQNFTAVNTWQDFSFTFTPDSNTQGICYCFTVVGTSGGTDTFTIRHCKLEKGSSATPWIPNSYDSQYSSLVTPFTYVTDTPKYDLATGIRATNQKIHISNFPTSGFGNSYSFAWWGNRSSNSPMFWGFSNGVRLNGMYLGYLWNTGDSANNPLYYIGTTTQVTPPSTGVWHHYVMTGNGTNCYVYLDGQLWAEAKTYKSISGDSIYINGWDASTYYCSSYTNMSDFRIYATTLNAQDVKQLYHISALADRNNNFYTYQIKEEEQKKISKKNIASFKGYIELDSINSNIMPNSVEMALGTANATSGTWRIAGTNNMTRSRVLITDSPIGECYGFQNSGTQPPTMTDGSCYGIDSFPFQTNTDYVISFWARKTTGTEAYAGCVIHSCTYGDGTDTQFRQNYCVSKLPESGEWFRYWKTFKTNGTANRNIYIGITTGETSVTTQMCAVKIQKGTVPTPWIPKETDSNYNTYRIKENTISINKHNGIFAQSFIEK